jgi:hypothetical protein
MFTQKEKMELGIYVTVTFGIFVLGCLVQSKFYGGKVKGYDQLRDALNSSLSACTSDEERSTVLRSYGVIK